MGDPRQFCSGKHKNCQQQKPCSSAALCTCRSSCRTTSELPPPLPAQLPPKPREPKPVPRPSRSLQHRHSSMPPGAAQHTTYSCHAACRVVDACTAYTAWPAPPLDCAERAIKGIQPQGRTGNIYRALATRSCAAANGRGCKRGRQQELAYLTCLIRFICKTNSCKLLFPSSSHQVERVFHLAIYPRDTRAGSE